MAKNHCRYFTLLIAILFIVSYIGKAQPVTQSQAAQMNSQELGNLYLERAKKQKTWAFVTLAFGTISSVVGSTILVNDAIDKAEESSVAGNVLALAGTTSLITSFTLFTKAHESKAQAKLLLGTTAIATPSPAFACSAVPSIGIAIPLGSNLRAR